MPSDKRYSTIVKATGLIASLVSAQLVPFDIAHHVQCMLHGLTCVLLCVPCILDDSERCQFVVVHHDGSPYERELSEFSVVTG